MDEKKLAAAMAAVFNYIKTQEEAAAYHSQDAANQPEPFYTGQMGQQMTGPVNIWGISGRQAQMQANTMMQMRAFK